MSSFFLNTWKDIQTWFKEAILKSSEIPSKKILKDPKCKILCVDDDRSFCFFLQQLAYSMEIQLDIAYSIQEAKEVIEQNPQYKAFIIDGHLLDGSGFELVAWIREKKEITLPIGFVSRIYQDAASFRILKESLKVNFVLEKPMHAEEVHQLFMQICNFPSEESKCREAFSEELLTGLKIGYQKTIPDKVERLEKMILDVQKNAGIDHLQILKNEVHKIAGSAGSYGYMEVSELCKHLEEELIKQIDLVKRNHFNKEWVDSLDDFFTQIKLHFQIKFSENDSLASLKLGILPSVYVVDEDPKFLTDFTHLIQNFNFEVLTESHPENAIQALLTKDFYPQIFLVNSHYRSSSMTGYDIIQSFYQRNDDLTCILALMVEAHALEEQVKAFKKGMLVVITKPFYPSFLLNLLDQIPFRALPLHFKILIIDDDLDISQFILHSLKFTGLQLETLHKLSDLEETVKNYQPDLILLDINLKDELHVGILHRIRKEWEYKKTLIGMLTLTQQDIHLLQQCYEANVDEILFKPLEMGVLQRKISLLLKKQTQDMLYGKGEGEREPKKLIETVPVFKRYLNELQKQNQPTILKMLVLFEIEGYKEIQPKIKKELLEYISQAIDGLLNKFEIAAHLEQGCFAFVYQGLDPNFVQLFMRDFLLQLQAYLCDHLGKAPFRIREALAILLEGEHVSNLLQKAQALLKGAAQQMDQSVVLITDPGLAPSKEVLIFHEPLQAPDFISNLFQRHHFKVASFSSFEELPQFNSLLPLFIIMGSINEAKELHLLKNLFIKNQIQVPILHLPHLPEMGYLERFLEGIHYFDAPFGLIILIANDEAVKNG